MKNVCVVTSTRAEYGLLSRLIHRLGEYDDIKVNLVVTGTHLSEKYGETVREIEADGVKIAAAIPILNEVNDGYDMSCVVAEAIKGFGSFLKRTPQDCTVLLGDRYEIGGFALASVLSGVPVAHIHGGEVTKGAIDDMIRHSLTKLSYLHFTSTEEYRRRVIQMGEEPDRVINAGAPGVENILMTRLLSREEVIGEVNRLCGVEFDTDAPYSMVTFHPVTTMPGQSEQQVRELLSALDGFGNMNCIITKANADAGGAQINRLLEEYAGSGKNNIALTASLGMQRYLSAMKYSAIVIGNSSSGIIEAPSFSVPTVNIGDRQEGRIRAGSVIDCDTDSDSITKAIDQALSEEFRRKLAMVVNPYEKKGTSEIIASTIRDYLIHDRFSIRKEFYDADNIVK